MGNIRKQSLYSSAVIITGFVVGAINMWFFTSNNYFTAEEFGLTRAFFDIAQNFMAFASLGLPAVMYKFFPYYQDNLEKKDNDLLAIAMIGGTIGFVLLIIAGVLFEPLVIRKFQFRSPLLVEYYYWIFPFTYFYLFYFLLESYSWLHRKTVLPNFLKEAGVRLLTTLIILLKIAGFIDFDTFVKLFSFTYGGIFLCIIVYLIREDHFHLNFSISRVTKKFYKKMLTLFSLTYLSQIINTLAITFDSILLASLGGLGITAAYNLATYAINLAMIPQRALAPITISHLSQAWKDKNMEEINRIYSRSSINLLAGGIFIVVNIWLGMENAMQFLGMNKEYYSILGILFILGLSKLVELGTGVNNYIIGTSLFWRFEFYSGIILLALTIPLNYFLIKAYGLHGAVISELIRVSVYNMIRMYFLWYKFKLQPFSTKTAVLLLISAGCYLLPLLLFNSFDGISGFILKCGSFSILFCITVYFTKVSPDVDQLIAVGKKRLGIGKR